MARHVCNCAYCPRRQMPWRLRLAGWCVTAGLVYWKCYTVVVWLGSIRDSLLR